MYKCNVDLKKERDKNKGYLFQMTPFIKVYFLTVLYMYIVNFLPFHTPLPSLSVSSLFFFPKISLSYFHVLFCL